MSKDIVAGGITGILSQLLTWSTEFLKTTKQLPKYNNQSIFKAVKKEYTYMVPKYFTEEVWRKLFLRFQDRQRVSQFIIKRILF